MAHKVSSPGIGRPLRRLKLDRSILILIGALGCGFIASLLVFAVSTSPYFFTSVRKTDSEAAFKAALDRSIPGLLHELRVPGVVLATVVNGVPSHAYAYGYADQEHHRPMRPDSEFRVASLSKSLTAWGVLRLAEQGKIALDAPVESYLPSWPLAPSRYPSSAVTVRNLLSHTSGLSEGADTLRQVNQPAKSALEVVTADQEDPSPTSARTALVQPAGKSYVYSAPGYMILQMVIENLSHQGFATYMDETVLKPLGMESSFFDWDESQRGRIVTPYMANRRPGELTIPDDTAADGLFSTALDMARFIAAPLPGGLPIGAGVLSADSVEVLYGDPTNTPRVAVIGVAKELPVLGSFVQKTPGYPDVITNGGFDPGWSSRYYMVPSTGDGLVILTNSSQGRPVIGYIASVWSAWRGLPILTMTSAYRSMTLAANLMIGLLTTLGVFLGGHFLADRVDERRRRVQLTWAGIFRSLPELVLAFAIIGVWIGAHKEVRVLPTLNGVGSAAILFYAGTVFLRLVMPRETMPRLEASRAVVRTPGLAAASMTAGA